MTGTDPGSTPARNAPRATPLSRGWFKVRPVVSDHAPSPAPRRLRWTAWAALVLFSGALLLTNLGNVRFLTRHEIFVAETAREMLLTGDWILPRFGMSPRLVKPPLAYWLTAVFAAPAGGV